MSKSLFAFAHYVLDRAVAYTDANPEVVKRLREHGQDIAGDAPGRYTNAMVRGWMTNEYSTLGPSHQPACLTGKPLSISGSLVRDDAKGRGGNFCRRERESRDGWNPSDVRVATQGSAMRLSTSRVFCTETARELDRTSHPSVLP